MNIDLSPALSRAQDVVNGLLVALSVALPSFQPGDVVQVLGISSVAIGFAFRDIVLFHDQTETTDGDRARQREGWPAGTGPVPGPRRTGEVAPSTAGDAKSERLAQE